MLVNASFEYSTLISELQDSILNDLVSQTGALEYIVTGIDKIIFLIRILCLWLSPIR